MQDFRTYDYTITPARLQELAGKMEVTIIINGEYYTLKPDEKTENK